MGPYVNMMDEVCGMNSSSIICEYLACVLYLSFLEKMSQGIETLDGFCNGFCDGFCMANVNPNQ